MAIRASTGKLLCHYPCPPYPHIHLHIQSFSRSSFHAAMYASINTLDIHPVGVGERDWSSIWVARDRGSTTASVGATLGEQHTSNHYPAHRSTNSPTCPVHSFTISHGVQPMPSPRHVSCGAFKAFRQSLPSKPSLKAAPSFKAFLQSLPSKPPCKAYLRDCYMQFRV